MFASRKEFCWRCGTQLNRYGVCSECVNRIEKERQEKERKHKEFQEILDDIFKVR